MSTNMIMLLPTREKFLLEEIKKILKNIVILNSAEPNSVE
jgi:hypothetical protein